jgi:hypothetical protein
MMAVVMKRKKRRSSRKMARPTEERPEKRFGTRARMRAMPLVDMLAG